MEKFAKKRIRINLSRISLGYDSEEWYSICDSNTDYYKIEVRELPLEIWAHIVSFLNLRDRVMVQLCFDN